MLAFIENSAVERDVESDRTGVDLAQGDFGTAVVRSSRLLIGDDIPTPLSWDAGGRMGIDDAGTCGSLAEGGLSMLWWRATGSAQNAASIECALHMAGRNGEALLIFRVGRFCRARGSAVATRAT